MLQAKLVVIGGAKAMEISLNLPAVIGRGRDASLTLPHPLVSRNHCQLYENDGMLHVKDLNSLNGTYVNSQRIENSAILEPEQLLTIGNVTFRAIYSPTDEAVANPDPTSSQVIEFEEIVSSPESDSQINPLQNRPTEEKLPEPEQPVNAFTKTVHINESPASSDIMHDLDEAPQTGTPEHSILAALQDVGITASPRDAAKISDIRSQLPSESTNEVNQVDGLVIDPAQAPAEKVDAASIDLDQSPLEKVNEDEPALGSFIRNLPR